VLELTKVCACLLRMQGIARNEERERERENAKSKVKGIRKRFDESVGELEPYVSLCVCDETVLSSGRATLYTEDRQPHGYTHTHTRCGQSAERHRQSLESDLKLKQHSKRSKVAKPSAGERTGAEAKNRQSDAWCCSDKVATERDEEQRATQSRKSKRADKGQFQFLAVQALCMACTV
jgi:hypothetical protein